MFKCKFCKEHLYSVYIGGWKERLSHIKYCKKCQTFKTHYGYPHLTYFKISPDANPDDYRTNIEKNNSPVIRNESHADK